MNKLSWLIYWADTLPSLASAVGSVFSMLALICLLVTLIVSISQGLEGDGVKGPPQVVMFSFPVFLFLALSSNLIPSKDTFYLIAASEAGEEALQTPEFSKVRQVINKWLDDQVAPEEKETN